MRTIIPAAVSSAYSEGVGRATPYRLGSWSDTKGARSHTPQSFYARRWTASCRTRTAQAGLGGTPASYFRLLLRKIKSTPKPRSTPDFVFALAYPHVLRHVVGDDRLDVDDLHRKKTAQEKTIGEFQGITPAHAKLTQQHMVQTTDRHIHPRTRPSPSVWGLVRK